MLIVNRAQFDCMLDAVKRSRVIAFDTEADGLYFDHGNRVVGISLYTDHDRQTWYIPIRHGYSDLEADVPAPADPAPRIGKTGKVLKPLKPKKADRQTLGLWYYQAYLRPETRAANLPVDWLDDLRAVWLVPEVHVAHNAPFDLTALQHLGFPTPKRVEDTMAMLAVVNTDWSGNRRDGVTPLYLMPDTGKEEPGNRQLKWQARLWGLDEARAGIDSLTEAVERLGASVDTLSGGTAVLDLPGAAAAHLWRLHPADVARYAEDDTRLTYLLWERINDRLATWGDTHVGTLFNRVVMATWRMNRQGVHINLDEADAMLAKGAAKLDELAAQIRETSGGVIENPGSPQQVKTYLHAIGLPVESTSKDALLGLRDVPIVGMIQHYRTLTISLSTFIQKWRDNAVGSKIRPSYNVGSTSSGRLSSSDDKYNNLQNVPRASAKADVNPKNLLYPPEGTIWIDIDFSALEVNIGAWVSETIGNSGDTTLTTLLEQGRDMHSYAMERSGIDRILLAGRTAEQYLRDNGYDLVAIEADGVTFEDYFRKKIARQTQKTANFAAQYGSGINGIVKAVGCTVSEASAMLEGFHTAFPSIKRAMDALEGLALTPRPIRPGSTEKALYVRYPIPELGLSRKFGYYPALATSRAGGIWSPRKKAARNAFNAVVQGTGGLIMLASILRIWDAFGFTQPVPGTNSVDYTEGIVTPLLTVHDSISFALRPADLYIVPRIVELMCDWPTRPRLKAEVSAALPGRPYGDTRDVKDMAAWITSGGTQFHA